MLVPAGALCAACAPLFEQSFRLLRGGGCYPPPVCLRFAWAPFSGDQVCGECLGLGATRCAVAVFLCLTGLESSTPSLTYINCPDLVHCVPTPLANPCLCSNNCFPHTFKQFSVRRLTHPRGGLLGTGQVPGGGLEPAAGWVPVAGSVAPSSCVGRVRGVPEIVHIEPTPIHPRTPPPSAGHDLRRGGADA